MMRGVARFADLKGFDGGLPDSQSGWVKRCARLCANLSFSHMTRLRTFPIALKRNSARFHWTC